MARPEVTVGLTRDEAHAYRWNGGEKMPGTTGILKVQDAIEWSGGLTKWAAATAVDKYIELGAEPFYRDQALAAIDTARDTGSAVHEAMDFMLGGLPIPPTPATSPYFYGIANFLWQYKPEVIAREQMVANLTHRFGGTFDLAAVINGKVSLIDVKTGSYKPNFGLQLAAYAAGEFVGKADDPEQYPIPEFEAFYVLMLQPNALPDLRPVKVGNRELDHFLYLTEVYHRLRAYKTPPVHAVKEVAA